MEEQTQWLHVLIDVAADVASYASGLETDPSRLAAVSERRAALTALTRKYGETVEEVLAWSETSAPSGSVATTSRCGHVIRVEADEAADLAVGDAALEHQPAHMPRRLLPLRRGSARFSAASAKNSS